jgi:hypothetical protein
MNAHAAPATRAPIRTSAWTIPLMLGVVYGGYAAFIAGNNGASTTRMTLIAVVGCLGLAVVCFVVGALRARLTREPRAAAFGVIFGCAMGYLLSLSGYSLLKASLVGLGLGLAMAAVSFYWFYGHEE